LAITKAVGRKAILELLYLNDKGEEETQQLRVVEEQSQQK